MSGAAEPGVAAVEGDQRGSAGVPAECTGTVMPALAECTGTIQSSSHKADIVVPVHSAKAETYRDTVAAAAAAATQVGPHDCP